MAEFQEVIKQTKRMCEANFDCSDCPLKGETQCIAQVHNGIIPSIWNEDTYRDMERIVMKWAEEHPEPRYPSWKKWRDSMFPDTACHTCPKHFLSRKASRCDDQKSCIECMNRPIPADIAEKLGIKPVEE